MKLSVDVYKKFISVINSLSKMISDIQIKDNRISQFCNSQSYFVYVDLNPLLGTEKIDSMELYNVENKLPLLKQFTTSTNDSIDIDITKDMYVISDGLTKLKIRTPDMASITNKFDISRHLVFNESDKYVTFSLDKILSKRLTNYINSLEPDSVKIKCENGESSITVDNKSGTTSVDIISGVSVLKDFVSTTFGFEFLSTGCISGDCSIDVYQDQRPIGVDIIARGIIETCPIEFRQVRKVVK